MGAEFWSAAPHTASQPLMKRTRNSILPHVILSSDVRIVQNIIGGFLGVRLLLVILVFEGAAW